MSSNRSTDDNVLIWFCDEEQQDLGPQIPRESFSNTDVNHHFRKDPLGKRSLPPDLFLRKRSKPATRDSVSLNGRQLLEEVRENSLFLAAKYAQLDKQNARHVARQLRRELTSAAVRKSRLRTFSKQQEDLLFEADEFTTSRRADGLLKMVVSAALKSILEKFKKDHHLNNSSQAWRDYVKSSEIKLLFFKACFRRMPARENPSEHRQVFDVQRGVTKQWAKCCLGLSGRKTPNKELLNRVLRLLREDVADLEDSYKQKIRSMTRRPKAGISVAPKKKKLPKAGLSAAPKKKKLPKSPVCIEQFRNATKLAYRKVVEMANSFLEGRMRYQLLP